jgi:undecaprenyl-diphosphatase
MYAAGILAAAVLGLIQGLTEFLPVSSSAHLILVPWLLGWKSEGLFFDVSLHIGTAIAVLAYFWSDWMALARETIHGLVEGKPFANDQRRLAWLLVVATIPAMMVGLVFEKSVEERLRSPLVTVVTLIGIGVLLYFADRRGNRDRTLKNLGLRDSIWIGMSQALALIPGVSRSGITISTALLRDVDRPAATRFSFLLSTPVIVGASLLEGWHFVKTLRHPVLSQEALLTTRHPWIVLAVGIATAAITGFFCIRYFLRYVQTNTFFPFVVYRIALAGIVLLFYFRA